MKHIAIITGANSGLGRVFVRQLDEGKGGPLDELWLIARNKEALEKVAQGTSTPCKVLALDLCDPASFQRIEDELTHEQQTLANGDALNVQWLVNCSGFGKFGPVTAIGAKANGNMIRLNCLAVVELCYRTLLHMHAGSRIINIASAAALVPQPGLSTYGATKRFVLDFSRALDFELRGSGIHVSAVCPKFMHTAFLEKPGDRAAVASMTWIGFEDPEHCVSESLKQSLRGKPCIFTSPDVAAMNVLCKVMPTSLVMEIEHAIGARFSAKVLDGAAQTGGR